MLGLDSEEAPERAHEYEAIIKFSEDCYFDWRSPTELGRLKDEHRASLGNRAMSGAGQTYRDAHVAARFSQHRNADFVRLLKTRSSQATPDFALLLAGSEQRFEITEADRPERRRTLEYRDETFPNEARLLTEDEWTSASEYKAVVRAIVLKKSAKIYDSCHGLIVWSNAFGITDDEAITSQWWSDACASGRKSFKEIWVHHRDRFEQIASS